MFCQRGSNSTLTAFFFLFVSDDGGVEDHITTKSEPFIGPPAKRYLNGVFLKGR